MKRLKQTRRPYRPLINSNEHEVITEVPAIEEVISNNFNYNRGYYQGQSSRGSWNRDWSYRGRGQCHQGQQGQQYQSQGQDFLQGQNNRGGCGGYRNPRRGRGTSSRPRAS